MQQQSRLNLSIAAPLAVFALASPGMAQTQSARVTALEFWYRLNEACRGNHADDPNIRKDCDQRNVASARLRVLGCSYRLSPISIELRE